MEVSSVKICTHCGELKDSLQFYKDARRRDGLRHWCKSCISEDGKTREHKYRDTRDRYREKSKTVAAGKKREKYKESREYILARNKEWRKSLSGRLASYKRAATKRNIGFYLTEKEFVGFWQKPCYYCNSGIETIGIDRIDSNGGYTLENSVPCCTTCNKMKMALGVKEFLNHINKIYNNLFGGNFYEVS